ncbi:MAG: OmpA family protein [Deltaproteobacteria bacterium]|nr:OmpA family protein [Deltaproteobacteria bacterium]
MNKSSVPDDNNDDPDNINYPSGEELEKLRSLLLGPEQEQIRQLQERLDNPELHANDIGRDLPQAIVMRSNRDDRLKTALMPTVEGIVKASVKKDYKIFSDALFPVIGPAIRKAISETFKSMIQSINKTLEQNFSWQGLKWRIEAFRTGKSYAEIILSHTLLYRVEQVFLIHKESGLLLQNVKAESVVFQDVDMVSGMLKAIQDFVQDSFRTKRGDTLNTLEFGELAVWIEQSPQAILAAVIRGIAPVELRTVFQNALENIHLEKNEALESFAGDTSPFEAVKNQLEDCLQSQLKAKKQKSSFVLWILLSVFVVFIGILSFFPFRDHQRWTHYLEELQQIPGIVVTSTEKHGDKYHIFGLRDPLSNDPLKILKNARLDPAEVVFRLEPYYSIYPEFMLKRIENILNPPETVHFEIKEGVLFSQGSAPHHWIFETRKLARLIPWPVQYRDDNIIDIEQKKFDKLSERINKQYLLFKTNASQYTFEHKNKLREIVSDIKGLLQLARALDKNVHIQIVGHTDSFGAERANLRLSRKRADNILSALIAKGLKKDNFSAIGIGEGESSNEETNENADENSRCVTLRVIISDIQN